MSATPDDSELRSCPFCGGLAYVHEDDYGCPHFCTCEECEMTGPIVRYEKGRTNEESRRLVIAAWNNRTADKRSIPREQILRIARTYGHAGCEPGTHRFCRLVEAIGLMGEREQEHLLQELRGGA